jgi:polygalacturonase/pectin methylesterase-like acyl-CoA thioesterase
MKSQSILIALLIPALLRAATPTPEPPPPKIPAGNFPITTYGAVGDGMTINTAAFAHAVEACEHAGGGSVIVPPGKFLTGPFTLGSHMALVVQKGAVIEAVPKFSAFGLPDPLPTTQDAMNKLRPGMIPLISASDVTDLAIRGDGVIDGDGAIWWAKSDRAVKLSGTGVFLPRPNLIVIKKCQRLQVMNVTLSNSPQFHLVPKLCSDVLIDGVKIYAPYDSPNTDAIDPSNSRNMLIRHVITDNGDDNVAFKASGDGPDENITVTDCTFYHGHGVSVGSETDGGLRNILVQRCTFQNTGTAIRIKSARTRGGLIQDVVYRDITMKDVDAAIYINLYYYDKEEAKDPQPAPVTRTTPMIRDVLISNVTCVNAKSAGEITALPESAATGITLENVSITSWTGFSIQDAKGLEFKNVSFTTSPKPPEPSPSPTPSEEPTSSQTPMPGTSPAGTKATGPHASPAQTAVPLTPAQKAAVKTGKITVAADGSGDFSTVQGAINAAPDEPQGGTPFLVHLKPGTYHEIITVPAQKGAMTMEGDNAATTIITGSNAAATLDANGLPLGTFRSATAFIQADGFTARNVTFQNSFGRGSQALAISVTGDRAAFHSCRFIGWQDTILTLQGREYYDSCYIAGAVDFIFGAATAWFQNCEIHCVSSGYITAASTPQNHSYGYVFSNCTIAGDAGVSSFLGRPWRPYAAVTFLNAKMSEVIRPDGWKQWTNIEKPDSVRYAEFQSSGAGANPTARVPWSRQLSAGDAAAITPAAVLGDWTPAAH